MEELESQQKAHLPRTRSPLPSSVLKDSKACWRDGTKILQMAVCHPLQGGPLLHFSTEQAPSLRPFDNGERRALLSHTTGCPRRRAATLKASFLEVGSEEQGLRAWRGKRGGSQDSTTPNRMCTPRGQGLVSSGMLACGIADTLSGLFWMSIPALFLAANTALGVMEPR